MPRIFKTIKMRGFRFPETLAYSQPQWVFWAIRNYPKNLHSFYIECNGEMTAKRTWVHAHVHVCVIHVYKKVLYKSYIKNWHFRFFWLKFSLRLRELCSTNKWNLQDLLCVDEMSALPIQQNKSCVGFKIPWAWVL